MKDTRGAYQVDKVKIGGLMRCCLETLQEYYPNGPEARAAEGDLLRCKYCSSSMIFRSGSWEWNREGMVLAA
jgi:hypothetical protein